MKSFFIFFTCGILSLFIHQSIYAQNSDASFAIPSSLPLSKSQPVKITSFHGSFNNNKILLQWVVEENQTANQFEVEKSVDGKNFVMAALVFGTDRPETENYRFYEKAGNKKISYRIKIIDKNQQTEYSNILVIDPANNISFVKN